MYLGAENIIYCKDSDYKFEMLNEQKFMLKLFKHLREMMKDEFDNYIFYILSTHKKSVFPDSALSVTNKKKILFFISDESSSIPHHLSGHYFAVFKSYYYTQTISENIFAFPLGTVKDIPEGSLIDMEDRKLNIFFSGYINNNRIGLYREFSGLKYFIPSAVFKSLPEFILNKIRQLILFFKFKSDFSNYYPDSLIKFSRNFKGGMNYSEYSNSLHNSKICLCPTGFQSPETFRHNEALRAGCVIISSKLPDTWFYKDSPIIQTDNWKTGLEIAKNILKKPEELKALSEASLNWYETHCSELATAKYIISCLNNLR